MKNEKWKIEKDETMEIGKIKNEKTESWKSK